MHNYYYAPTAAAQLPELGRLSYTNEHKVRMIENSYESERQKYGTLFMLN